MENADITRGNTITYRFYDQNYVATPNGLRNTGAICWSNSLIQVLLGCPSFNEVMLENESQCTNNELGKEFISAIKVALPAEEIVADATENEKRKIAYSGISSKLVGALMRELRKSRPSSIFGLQQECADEACILLLDALNLEPINRLFNNRYEAVVYCPKCKEPVGTKVDPCQRKIELFSRKAITDRSEFIKFILSHPQPTDDYKCEKCNTVSKNTFRVYSLQMLREVIVITFNKYFSKTNRWFPDSLEFPALNNTCLKYKLIGKIEHSGSIHGGHYWAHSLRYDETGNEKWYQFNDMSVSEGNPNPSPNTYMVVYHLSEEVPDNKFATAQIA